MIGTRGTDSLKIRSSLQRKIILLMAKIMKNKQAKMFSILIEFHKLSATKLAWWNNWKLIQKVNPEWDVISNALVRRRWPRTSIHLQKGAGNLQTAKEKLQNSNNSFIKNKKVKIRKILNKWYIKAMALGYQSWQRNSRKKWNKCKWKIKKK